MGQRFSWRRDDGTIEYYDTKEEVDAARSAEFFEHLASFFALAGFVIGGLLTYMGMQFFGGTDWPKLVRFSVVVAAALGSAVVSVLLTRVIYWLFATVVTIGIYTASVS